MMNTTTQTKSLAQVACTELSGIGPRTAERLAKCGILTVQDLLFYLPYRYQDRTRITPIADLRFSDYAVIEGVIQSNAIKFGKRRSLICTVSDPSGILQLRFFNFSGAQQRSLAEGSKIRCFGEVRGRSFHYEMVHPEYRIIADDVVIPVEAVLTPIYHTTAGLAQRSLHMLTEQALARLDNGYLPEYLPDELLAEMNMLPLADAIRFAHRPPPDADVQLLEAAQHPAQQRLAFEELLVHRLCLRRLRAQFKQRQAVAIPIAKTLQQQFLQQLPFALTQAQQRVAAEIQQDLSQAQPMLRLVQGDVGSGKTVVAALAAIQAVASGHQVALMAPTEILAEQHVQNFTHWFTPLGMRVAWLIGKQTVKERREIFAALKAGEIQVIVGTHALFQKDVEFNQLTLVIIDEQHRFGVHQRLSLWKKGNTPHQLVMTATPIPRTLSMTAYADLDVSVIDELPPGRTPVQTVVLPTSRRQDVIERIRTACLAKKQIYWVCTLIEESEVVQCRAAEKASEQLHELLAECRIALIHGRLTTKEKEEIMRAFKAHQIDLLVATTVIEVGVDVPNASLMIIENAERLGLAQLHQLRGRVGRGSQQSYCVLLYQTPLSDIARRRLQIMREYTDGFKIAEEDLKIRGPGELLGTRQTGLAQMRVAHILRDKHLLPKVCQAADLIQRHYPERIDLLIDRWLAEGQQYGAV